MVPTPQLSRSDSSTPVPSVADIQHLTVADELSLVTFYLTKISQLCGAFRFPEMVEATAMSYLKRFYLRNTCMDYHPKNVMSVSLPSLSSSNCETDRIDRLTSLFLATKTENHLISIDTFAGKIKTTPEEILSLEFLVSQSLHFEYKVHHAHLAGHGLSLDMEVRHLLPDEVIGTRAEYWISQTANIPSATIDAAWTRAKALIRVSRLTDAEFIYTPSQIALAAFRLADATAVDNWLGLKEPRSGAVEGEKMEHDALRECLIEIGELMLEAERKGVDTEAVREVDVRLRWARNPEKDPKSAMSVYAPSSIRRADGSLADTRSDKRTKNCREKRRRMRKLRSDRRMRTMEMCSSDYYAFARCCTSNLFSSFYKNLYRFRNCLSHRLQRLQDHRIISGVAITRDEGLTASTRSRSIPSFLACFRIPCTFSSTLSRYSFIRAAFAALAAGVLFASDAFGGRIADQN